MARRLVHFSMAAAMLLVLLAILSAPVAAGEAAQDVERESRFQLILIEVVQILVFSALGLLVLLLGFRALDMATPFSLNKEIAEDDNTAAGVVVAGMMIALGLIIHGALTM
ncbi:MAG: DUF350 domain-containing protein [Planctomycetota bacterium]|jgi:hypothetical protein